MQEVAARLGVSSHSLYKWVQAVSPDKDEQRADELRATASVRAEAKEVEAVAFSLISLAYGESSFNFLGVKAGTRKRVRNKALALVDTLVTGAAR